MAQYYIIYNGQQVGPMEKYQLRNYNIDQNSQVWTEGMPQWAPAGTVADLQDVLPQPHYQQAPPPPQNYGPSPYGNNDYGYPGNPYGAMPYSDKNPIAAGLLAIFLGSLGVQYFYLGKSKAGVIVLLSSILTCGAMATIWAILFLIQGIIMLTLNQPDFDRKFVYTPSSFPMF